MGVVNTRLTVSSMKLGTFITGLKAKARQGRYIWSYRLRTHRAELTSIKSTCCLRASSHAGRGSSGRVLGRSRPRNIVVGWVPHWIPKEHR